MGPCSRAERPYACAVIAEETETEAMAGSSVAGPQRWWERRSSTFGLVFGSYLVLSLVVLWPLVENGFATRLPFGADVVLDSWGLSWLPHAITHGANPFHTDLISFPGGVNLLANTSQLGLALVEWPVTAAFGPTAAFNLSCVLAPPLGGGAMYLLCRRFTARRTLAWFGGLLYGFGAYEMTALGSFHIQLFFAPIPPLLFLALHELLVERRPKPWQLGLGITALVVAQFFISTEVLAITAVAVAATGVVGAALSWRSSLASWRYLVVAIGVAASSSLLLLAYPAWFAMAGPSHIKGLVILTPQAYRADLVGLLYPTTAQAIAPARATAISQHFATATSENYSYLGIPLTLAFLVGAAMLWRRRAVLIAALVALGGWVLSLGGGLAVAGLPSMGATGTEATGTWLPGRVIEDVPLFENMIPSRWALFTAIGVSVVVVALADRILGDRPALAARPPWRAIGVSALLLACAVPLLPRLPLAEAQLGQAYLPPKALAKVAASSIPPGAGVATFPYPTSSDLSPVVWQSKLGFPFKMAAAYFRVPQGPTDQVAFDPVYGYGYSSYAAQVLYQLQRGQAPAISDGLRVAVASSLAEQRISYVVATFNPSQHGGADAQQQAQYLQGLFGPPIASRGIVEVFRVAAPTTAR